MQKLSVKNNAAKQRVKRDLKELSLFDIFKQYTVKTIKELVYERFKDFGITREDLGIKDGYGNTDYGKYNTIAKKLEDRAIDQQSFVISYDKISEKTYDKIIANLGEELKLIGEEIKLKLPVSKVLEQSLFEKYFDTIKTFYSEARNQFFPYHIISFENDPNPDNNFPIVFLPWLEDISFLDDGKNGVKIAEMSTYQKILDKYDSWKDVFKSISEKSGYLSRHELPEIKFDIACLINDKEKAFIYLNKLDNKLKEDILQKREVWQLIFKYNIDSQKRVEFIQSIFELTRNFGHQAITNIGTVAFKHAAAQNDEQVMAAVLNEIEDSGTKATILYSTLMRASIQNDNKIIGVVLDKAVELNKAPIVLSLTLFQAFTKEHDQLITAILNKAVELNVAPEVLNAIFSTAFNKNDTKTMARVLDIAIERNIEIDLSEVVKSDKKVDILVVAFFKASGRNDYIAMLRVLRIIEKTNLVEKVLYAGFIYSQNNNDFKSFKRLWNLADALQYDNKEIKKIKLQALEHNDFHIPVSIAKSRNSEEVNFLYEEIKKIDEDIQLKIFKKLFILAIGHNNAEMVYDIWSKAERLVGDNNQVQLQLLKADNFKAFRLSAQHENKEIIEFLYSKAEKFGIQNEMLEFDRFRALGLAVESDCKDIVEFLIKKRPDIVNAVIDHLDNTVLHRAVFLNRIDIVEILLKNGAAVDIQNQHYVTPLYRAVYYNYVDIARLLIEKGARIDVKGDDRETALDLANSKMRKSNTPEEQQKYQRIIDKLSNKEVSAGASSACLPKKSKKGRNRNKREIRIKRAAGGSKCLLVEDEKGKIDQKKTGIKVNKKNLAKSKINKKKLKAYQEDLNNRLNIAIAQSNENAQNLIKEEQGQLNKLILEIQQAQAIRDFHILSKEVDEKLLPALRGNDNISPESLQYFEQIIKINLLRIALPLIRSEKFKDFLLNNPEKFGQDQGLLDNIFAGIKGAISNEYKEKLSYEDFENIKNEINEQISSVEVEIENLADQDVNKSYLSNYVFMSMGLSELLADTDASTDLRNRMSYEALVTLGALIHDHENHIKANHHGHKHNPHMSALNDRIGKNQLLAIAHDLHKLHKDNVNQDELKSKAIKAKIGSYGNIDNKYIINDLFNQFSSKGIKSIFNKENINGLGAMLEQFKNDVVNIRSNQISITGGKTTIRVQHGSKTVELPIGKNEDINNINNYVLDEQNLQIKLKIDGKEYIITPELEGEKVKYCLNIGGYKVKIGSIINNVGRSVERDIHHKLNQLKNKNSIEDVAELSDVNQDINKSTNDIKQEFLKLGVRKETLEQFDKQLESLSEKIYTEYVNTIEKDLIENNIKFDNDKFKLAKIKGAKGGKFMSFLAIYDLFDSTNDLTGLKDAGSLQAIFGINGIFDAMDNVRESLSTQYIRSDGKIKTRLSRSGLGKITSKVPRDVRKVFVRMINNPVVQGITFVTIAWQFGHSIDKIIKGENIELNAYFATSSGIKLTSMGVSFGTRIAVSSGVKATSVALRHALQASKVLGRASMVTVGVDIVVTVGIAIHERMEYTKTVAEQIPLLPGDEQAEVFFAKLIQDFQRRDIEKEYENHIRLKNYLMSFKTMMIELLKKDSSLSAVIHYLFNVEEQYDEIIKRTGFMTKTASRGYTVCGENCGLERNNTHISYRYFGDTQSNLSELNISKTLSLTLYTLVMTEWWERFKCDVESHFNSDSECHSDLNNKQAYFTDLSKKHLPYLTVSEYNSGIRIIRVPQSYKESTECGAIKNSMDYKINGCNLLKIGDEYKCNVDKVHKTCKQTFTLSNEPIILTKIGNNQKGKIIYLLGPKTLTAAGNYPAIIHVPESCEEYIGSANYETTFIVNDNTGFCSLEGGLAMAEKNIISLNINAHSINVYLDIGRIIVNTHKNVQSSIINLQNIYSYISNSTAQQFITTDCRTRYVNAGGGSRGNTVRQGSINCKDEDHEVRVVHKNDVHYRGSKQVIFIVNRDSNNATITIDNNFNINKNNTIIRLEGLGIERLRIKEAEGYYNLTLLTDDGQAISVKVVDDLKNLAIYTEENQTIVVQDKSLPDLTRDMAYQKLNRSGEYIDDRILENSETKLKAVILQEVDYIGNTPHTAKNVADRSNNFGIPSQVVVTKHREKELIEQAVIYDTYSNDIYVDLAASRDFKFGYPFSYIESIKTKDENITIFGFLDGSRVHLNRNGHNITGYVFNETRSVSDVIASEDYQDIVNELNTTIPIKFSDEVMIIGTKGDNALNNDPNHRTHLIGNGGKDKYVIDINLSNSSIPEVTIYDSNNPTVDMSYLTKKLKDKLGIDFTLQQWLGRNSNIIFDSSINDKIFSRVHIKQCKLKDVNNLVPFSEDMGNVSVTCGFNQELLRITWKNISSTLDDDNYDPLRDLKNLFNYNHADISAQDNQGNTALHFACKNCNYGVAKYLIEEKNARINVKNKDGKTPLDLANECQQSKKEQIVELFRKAQSELDKSLLVNARDGNLAEVRSLISRGASLDIQDNEEGYTPLHYAAEEGYSSIVRIPCRKWC